MRTLIIVLVLALCKTVSAQNDLPSQQILINKTLDDWHAAAASAQFDAYFGLMSDDSRFIGTDPTENWSLKEFKDFAKPHFDRGTAWDFKTVQRNVYIAPAGNIAWFDELLSGWMKICRGSGVLTFIDGHWKISHYVLSMTIPNDHTNEVIKIKQAFDDDFLNNIKKH